MGTHGVDSAQAAPGSFRVADGLRLLGEQPAGQAAEPQYLVSRADGEVLQLTRLLYLVSAAIAEVAAAEDGVADPEQVARLVSPRIGRDITAANVRYLITGKLTRLGVVVTRAPDRSPEVPTSAPASPDPDGRPGRPGRRPGTVVLAAIAVLAVAAGGTLAVVAATRPAPVPLSASASQARAAAWVAAQVSPGTTVSCDPATCGLARRDGFPAGRLLALGPASRDPLGSGVVIATQTVRSQFGARLASVYAPVVIAGFGQGDQRVEVRAIAPGGAPAYRAALAAQHTSLSAAGRQLLGNRTVQATPAARAALLGGRVDPRLLAIMSVLSSQQAIRLEAFDGAPPGASSLVPLRSVQLGAGSAAGRSAILTFLDAQQGTYRPDMMAAARDASGQPVVAVRFDAPGPLPEP